MDHQEIERDLIVENYLRGSLSKEQSARFEEHYLDCNECQQRLDLMERFDRALKGIAGDQRWQAADSPGRGSWFSLPRLHFSWEGAFALVLIVTTALSLWGLVSKDRQLQDANARLGDQIRLEEEQRRRSEDFRDRLQDAQRELASLRAGGPVAPDDAILQPQLHPLILRLSPQRSATEDSEPGLRLRLDDTGRWIVFRLELNRPPSIAHRLTLRGPDDQALWRGEGIEADNAGRLSLGVESADLTEGVYTLLVEAQAAQRDPAFVARFAFRVSR